MSGKLVGASRSFAAPERYTRRCALRVFDKHAAGSDATYAPGSVAEQNDVAGKAFDGKVFVYRADGDALGLGNDGIQRICGDCPAAGDGGKPRATARAQNMIHAIAVQISSVTA